MPSRNVREYGLTPSDRNFEIERRFGTGALAQANRLLSDVSAPTDQILGAIIFLARNISDLPDLVALANSDPKKLLNAATVKDERG